MPGNWEERLADAFDPLDCGERTYEHATLLFENPETGRTETYADVGVRYRGHNVYDDSAMERHGFKISFDEFVPGRTFHGLEKVNLLGTEGDYSLLRERLALGLMVDSGVPAPRVGHADLYVNGRYMGVFPDSEEADDQPFLDAHFSDPDGTYYKVKGYCGERSTLEWISDDPLAYASTYEPKAGTDTDDLVTDLLPMLACASSATDEEFATCIPQQIDVDEWLNEMAVDMVLPDVDGLASAGQNFLLYRPPEGRFLVVPWDKDLSLALTNYSPEASGIFDLHPAWLEGSQPALANRLRTVYRDRFCRAVLDVAERYDPEVFVPKIEELRTLLAPDVADDPFLESDQWGWIIDDLDEVVRTRHPAVVEEATTCAG
jgi:spore coat protein CotH